MGSCHGQILIDKETDSYIYGVLGKRAFCQILKNGLLAELEGRTSRSCRYLLFWHHKYQVSLTVNAKGWFVSIMSNRSLTAQDQAFFIPWTGLFHCCINAASSGAQFSAAKFSAHQVGVSRTTFLPTWN